MEGAVNVVQLDNGWIRVGGELKGHEGSFSLNTNGSEVFGRILFPGIGVGYTIRMDAGTPVLVETRLSTLVCYPGMNPQAAAATSDGVARKAVAAAEAEAARAANEAQALRREEEARAAAAASLPGSCAPRGKRYEARCHTKLSMAAA